MRKKQNVIYNKGKDRLWVLKDGKYDLDFAVVALLLQEDGLTTYGIKKKLEKIGKQKIPYSTLHGVIKGLAKSKYIAIVKKKPFRTKLEKKFYDITRFGVGAMVYRANIDSKQFLEAAIKKKYLHPFFEKIEPWKLNETPEITMFQLGSGSRRGIYSEYAGSAYAGQITYTIEEITADFVEFLIAIVFYDEFDNFVKKNEYGVFAHTYIALLKNDAVFKKEAEIFIKNNPWVKARMKAQLKLNLETLQNEAQFLEKLSEKICVEKT